MNCFVGVGVEIWLQLLLWDIFAYALFLDQYFTSVFAGYIFFVHFSIGTFQNIHTFQKKPHSLIYTANNWRGILVVCVDGHFVTGKASYCNQHAFPNMPYPACFGPPYSRLKVLKIQASRSTLTLRRKRQKSKQIFNFQYTAEGRKWQLGKTKFSCPILTWKWNPLGNHPFPGLQSLVWNFSYQKKLGFLQAFMLFCWKFKKKKPKQSCL